LGPLRSRWRRMHNAVPARHITVHIPPAEAKIGARPRRRPRSGRAPASLKAFSPPSPKVHRGPPPEQGGCGRVPLPLCVKVHMPHTAVFPSPPSSLSRCPAFLAERGNVLRPMAGCPILDKVAPRVLPCCRRLYFRVIELSAAARPLDPSTVSCV